MGEQLTNRTAKMTSGGTCLLHHENNANSRSHHAVQSQYASPSCPQTPPLLVVSLSPSSRATIALQILEGTFQQALFRMRLWLSLDVQPLRTPANFRGWRWLHLKRTEGVWTAPAGRRHDDCTPQQMSHAGERLRIPM